MSFRKDESLNEIADLLNVAQFISFLPGVDPQQAYSRIAGFAPNHIFATMAEGLEALLECSVNNSVNLRSFKPDDPRSHEFIYGLRTVGHVRKELLRIALSGFHVIVNETIDIHDGGVSGVLQSGIIEFSPDDTPRCVEKPGTVSIFRTWGFRILSIVYGFPVEVDVDDSYRLEFSVHPRPCGWRKTHFLGWELEDVHAEGIAPSLSWPNNFSRLIGDKAFGLIVASVAGLPVPMTTVISRRIAPFVFGTETRSAERWIRTCPTEQAPGRYTTHHGWLDPFLLMNSEDPNGTEISSVISQHAVNAQYSGALIVNNIGEPVIEGMKGEGEAFMLGTVQAEVLPHDITSDVVRLYSRAHDLLGPVRFEWVHDGKQAWIVQLHRGATVRFDNIIVPGEADVWHSFDILNGLPQLRELLSTIAADDGITLIGQIGLTSHVADTLRKSKHPARILSSGV